MYLKNYFVCRECMQNNSLRTCTCWNTISNPNPNPNPNEYIYNTFLDIAKKNKKKIRQSRKAKKRGESIRHWSCLAPVRAHPNIVSSLRRRLRVVVACLARGAITRCGQVGIRNVRVSIYTRRASSWSFCVSRHCNDVPARKRRPK